MAITIRDITDQDSYHRQTNSSGNRAIFVTTSASANASTSTSRPTPRYQLCWMMLDDISTTRTFFFGGGRGVTIAYKPTSTNQLPPNFMPSSNFSN